MFDLDDTLVDTHALLDARNGRRWHECRERLVETVVFPGVAELLARLVDDSVYVAIVTNSVSNYAEAVLKHHRLPYNTLVAYHDTRRHKPEPEPVRVAMIRAGTAARSWLGVGDREQDRIAYSRARIPAVGAGWSPYLETENDWTHVASTPTGILSMLGVSA